MPLTNVPIPDNASNFIGLLSGVATFDIPNVDMESVFGKIVECPEEDGIHLELQEDEINDETVIGNITWSELKI